MDRLLCSLMAVGFPLVVGGQAAAAPSHLIVPTDRRAILRVADTYLHQKPVTITAFPCRRDPGGIHEYYSEGLYWWPDPKNPEGPYIRRDGRINPGNFTADKKALSVFSDQISALCAAWRLTHRLNYAHAAIRDMRAWFITASTRMAPNLQFAQAIPGICSGRGTGILDSVRLVPVARGAQLLEQHGVLTGADKQLINRWFSDYLHWMTTSPHGLAEMRARNNHGTIWVLQVAAYASLLGDHRNLTMCRRRYEHILLPRQMAANGSFPLELARTRPFHYSLYNLNAMATLCQILSNRKHNLWQYSSAGGRSMKRALAFIYPYVQHRSAWPYRHDVTGWNRSPVRPTAYLFGGLAYHDVRYIRLWRAMRGRGRHVHDWFNPFAGPSVLWLKVPWRNVQK